MSYITPYTKTKLSDKDKIILKEIYNELEQIHIRSTFSTGKGSYHAKKTGTTDQKDGRQTSFGITTYQGQKQKSESTIKYPYFIPLFKKFIKSHYPEFKFKTVFVNKNTICKEHLDSANTGESLLVGLGPYTGGRTILHTGKNFDKEKKFHIKTYSLLFNGSEIPHESEPFDGTRYSLVFYK